MNNGQKLTGCHGGHKDPSRGGRRKRRTAEWRARQVGKVRGKRRSQSTQSRDRTKVDAMGIRSTGEPGRGCDCDLAVQLLAPAFPSGTSGLTLACITWDHLIMTELCKPGNSGCNKNCKPDMQGGKAPQKVSAAPCQLPYVIITGCSLLGVS